MTRKLRRTVIDRKNTSLKYEDTEYSWGRVVVRDDSTTVTEPAFLPTTERRAKEEQIYRAEYRRSIK